MTRGLPLAVCLFAAVALGQGGSTKAAQDELERQLREMVGKPPTRVKVTFIGLDEPQYKLDEVAITLDGAPLSTPSNNVLSQEGEHLIFEGDYKAGDHKVDARVTIVDSSSTMFSYQAGYRWKAGVSRTFTLQPGLEVHVVLTPARDSSATQIEKKFKLSSTATPRMLAVLDDGKMPEPLARAKVAAAEVDAGTPGPSAADAAAEAKRLAAEEKKRKAEEAAAAKAAAAEEKKRKAEEAAEAKRVAAEEKQRQADEAKAAKLAAAEEKRRLAEEKKAIAAGKLPTRAVGEAGAVAAGVAAVEFIDAGAPEIADTPEVVDAGTPVAAVRVAEARPVEPVKEEGGPLWVIIGAGGGLLIALLIILARRRSNPRDPGL
jgi:hypothetical protein